MLIKTLFSLSIPLFCLNTSVPLAQTQKNKSIEQLYLQYSSKYFIKTERERELKHAAQKRIEAILHYQAQAQVISLKKSLSPELKRAREKRESFVSLQKLLNKISPVKN
jgi:hypothetical protein